MQAIWNDNFSTNILANKFRRDSLDTLREELAQFIIGIWLRILYIENLSLVKLYQYSLSISKLG
jgi:hypothetical protein